MSALRDLINKVKTAVPPSRLVVRVIGGDDELIKAQATAARQLAPGQELLIIHRVIVDSPSRQGEP
jgi:hypothetical protein